MSAIDFINQFNHLSTQIQNSFTSAEAIRISKEELYLFLDKNYETYLNSNFEERMKIRKIFKELHSNDQTNNFLDFFMLGYIQTAIGKIEVNGEKEWLIRGLTVAAIEDGICDHRDSIDLLTQLFVTAKEKDLEPEIEFQKISKLANDKPSLSGSKPMSQIMLEISNQYK